MIIEPPYDLRSSGEVMKAHEQPAIMLAANSAWNLVNFRAPVIAGLRRRGFAIIAAVPIDDSAPMLRDMGVEVHHVTMDARGLSPLRDGQLLLSYYALLRRLRPSAFLTFTAKPNIYGSMAAAVTGVPVINTISGLGTGFLSGRALQGTVSMLYRAALRRSHRVFFHNDEDRDLFIEKKLTNASRAIVVAGSGVNLERFAPTRKSSPDQPITFLFIGRLLKDKGVLEFAEAASIVRQTRRARFLLLGPVENHPKAVPRETLEQFVNSGSIEILSPADDVRAFISESDCVVLPSYREGLPRVLLEASAMAKPIIATDVPGCRQALEDGRTGLLCAARSAASLAEAMIRFVEMTPRARQTMGARGREKAEREFAEEMVVQAYLDSVQELGL